MPNTLGIHFFMIEETGGGQKSNKNGVSDEQNQHKHWVFARFDKGLQKINAPVRSRPASPAFNFSQTISQGICVAVGIMRGPLALRTLFCALTAS